MQRGNVWATAAVAGVIAGLSFAGSAAASDAPGPAVHGCATLSEKHCAGRAEKSCKGMTEKSCKGVVESSCKGMAD